MLADAPDTLLPRATAARSHPTRSPSLPPPCGPQVEKEVAKASALMEDVEAEIGRKKGVSKRVKALQADIGAAQHAAQQLEAQHQHLKRQQAALQERIARLEAQCRAKHDAAESSIEVRAWLLCWRWLVAEWAKCCAPRCVHAAASEPSMRLPTAARACPAHTQERLRDKEAVEAEHAAAAARLQENEAMVRRE